jgi:hypothetical protein
MKVLVVENVECETTVNGEQDILKLYEFDKCHVYRLLPKVTDRHVKLGVESQMKVNLAAQIISSSVTAAFNALVTTGNYNCIVSLNRV